MKIQARRLLERGFTLIELMMVTVIIAILAAIAIPNMLSARMGANETAAISILRTISTAEAQFQRAGYADENHDGQGEYGYLAELCGVVNVRGTTRKATSTLSTSVGMVTASGESQRSGFIFRMYLPQALGVGLAEQPNGGAPAGALDPSNAAIYWACYAFPGHFGGTGNRTFFVNQRCELMTATDSRYQLPGCASLSVGAAMKVGLITHMTGQLAFSTRGADGNLWKAVQ